MVDEWITLKSKNFYCRRIYLLRERRTKVVVSEEQYFE